MRNGARLAILGLLGIACASGIACATTPNAEPAPALADAGSPSPVPTTTAPPTDPTPVTDDGGADAAPPEEPITPIPTPPYSPNPSPTFKIKDLTGPGTSSKTFGVGGTDLGIPIRQPNGKIAYIFGDTYAGDGLVGGGWRSPVLLRSEPGNLAAGITFNGAAGGAYAKQILDYEHDTDEWSTWLPSDVITIGKRMYLHFIVNHGLGNVKWTQIAYSDDNGENWTLSNAKFPGDADSSRRQVWTWERGTDGYVYIMSTKFITRDQPIIMYRVPDTKILDVAAYQPWGYKNGQWAWGNPASVILDGAFGELCLRRVENKWVLSAFNAGDANITIKVFDSPTSNLYDETLTHTYVPIHGVGWGFESDTSVAQLYGGYIHPDSTLHDLHLIISQWNTSSGTGWPYRAMQFVTGVE